MHANDIFIFFVPPARGPSVFELVVVRKDNCAPREPLQSFHEAIAGGLLSLP